MAAREAELNERRRRCALQGVGGRSAALVTRARRPRRLARLLDDEQAQYEAEIAAKFETPEQQRAKCVGGRRGGGGGGGGPLCLTRRAQRQDVRARAGAEGGAGQGARGARGAVLRAAVPVRAAVPRGDSRGRRACVTALVRARRRETSDTLRARDSELLEHRYAEVRKKQEDEKERARAAEVRAGERGRGGWVEG